MRNEEQRGAWRETEPVGLRAFKELRMYSGPIRNWFAPVPRGRASSLFHANRSLVETPEIPVWDAYIVSERAPWIIHPPRVRLSARGSSAKKIPGIGFLPSFLIEISSRRLSLNALWLSRKVSSRGNERRSISG